MERRGAERYEEGDQRVADATRNVSVVGMKPEAREGNQKEWQAPTSWGERWSSSGSAAEPAIGEDAKSRRTESGLGERGEREEVKMSQRRRREPVDWLVPYRVKGKLSPAGTAAELAVWETRSRDENKEGR